MERLAFPIQPATESEHLGYPDDLAHAREVLHRFGATVVVPQRHLFGRQPLYEYSLLKRRRVENELRTKGWDFLLENPAVICPLEGRGTIQLVVLDGHHRTRYSPQFGFRDMPSFLIPQSLAADLFRMDRTTFEQRLSTDVSETLHSFGRMHNAKQPQVLLASNLAEVQAMFPHF